MNDGKLAEMDLRKAARVEEKRLRFFTNNKGERHTFKDPSTGAAITGPLLMTQGEADLVAHGLLRSSPILGEVFVVVVEKTFRLAIETVEEVKS